MEPGKPLDTAYTHENIALLEAGERSGCVACCSRLRGREVVLAYRSAANCSEKPIAFYLALHCLPLFVATTLNEE